MPATRTESRSPASRTGGERRRVRQFIAHRGRRFFRQFHRPLELRCFFLDSEVVRIKIIDLSHVVGREVANGKEAKKILKIDTFYNSIEETLAKNGFAPNRNTTSALQQAAE